MSNGVTNVSPSSGFISGQSTVVNLSFTQDPAFYAANFDETAFAYSADFDLFSTISGGSPLGELATYENIFSNSVSPLSINTNITFNIPSGLSSGTYYVGASFGGSRFAITVSAPVNNITISFDINGGTGTTPASITKQSGSVFTLPTSSGFSRSGFIVNQWNTDSSGTGINYNLGFNQVIYNTRTLFARWIPIFYNILIDENGGSLVQDSIYSISTSNQTRTLTRPVAPAGRTFKDWRITLQPSNNISTPFTSNNFIIPANTTGNIGIRATYNVIQYGITYVLDGGTNSNQNPTGTYNVDSEAVILFPATKSGFIFNGWYLNSNFTNQIFAIGGGQIGNLTLYAKFDNIKYIVNFINNGVNIKSTQENFGTDINNLIPVPNPTKTSVKEEFIFLGWNETSSATTATSNLGTVSRNITFHAIYKSFKSGLKINNKNVNLKIGADQIEKVYIGTTLIWEKIQ